MSDRSILEWHGFQGGHRCGYCKSAKSNLSHGMSAHRLTTDDYQSLIDRGWRRSGTYLYKPTLKATCCPMYPIRCSVLELELTKSQRQCIKRVNKFLNYGIGVPRAPRGRDGQCQEGASGTEVHSAEKGNKEITDKHHQPKPGVGADPNKPACVKAKQRRAERMLGTNLPSVETSTPGSCTLEPAGHTEIQSKVENLNNKKQSKTLEELLSDIIPSPAHKLELRLVETEDDEFMNSASKSYQVYVKYQMFIHGDEEAKLTRRQYTGFLVDSPLTKPAAAGSGSTPPVLKAGSYHQQYWLDGRLIAVGVIDILPHCVSSVYLYYDPEFSFLSLGTYSALREIAFTRQLHLTQPNISYYYLGFYIHSCPKMRYKGQYKPSHLCCPETYTWQPIENCMVKLDVNKYSRFAEQVDVGDSDAGADISQVLCLYRRNQVSFNEYLKLNKKKQSATDISEVTTYSSLVGGACARRMLLYRQ